MNLISFFFKQIPLWCYPNQQLYIRVTLVTVTSDRIPYHCIHPYAIDTSDENTIEDKPNNSIFFRINENEFNTREKRYQLKNIFLFINF